VQTSVVLRITKTRRGRGKKPGSLLSQGTWTKKVREKTNTAKKRAGNQKYIPKRWGDVKVRKRQKRKKKIECLGFDE